MKREKKQFKYQLIHDALAAKIAAGLLEQLPSEENLCREFDAGRNIVRQALQMLSEEGYIIKGRGKRTQICHRKFADPIREAKLVLLQRHDYLGVSNNPVYAGIVSRLLEIAAQKGCHPEMLYLPEAGNPGYARFVVRQLREADGIFLTSLRPREPVPEIEEILLAHPRTICVDNAVGTLGKYHVGTDNYAGGLLAAGLVAGAGCKRPLIYSCGDSFETYSPMLERCIGFRDGCQIHLGGFDRKEQLVVDEVFPEYHVIFERMKRLLSEKDFDAVFVLSDLAAAHVVRALRALGRSVPGEISVIGFDGIAQHGVFKDLTSIRQNIEAVSEQSFSLMEKLLRNEIVTGNISLSAPSLKEGGTLILRDTAVAGSFLSGAAQSRGKSPHSTGAGTAG